MTDSDGLERRARGGDSEAELEMGRLCEADDRTALARGWFARAAKQGNLAALRALAINLLTQTPIVERDGVNMIRSAAENGDAEAMHVCAMLAAQDPQLSERWKLALEYLAVSAERGYEPARAQLAFLGEGFSAADALAATEPFAVRQIRESPRISVVANAAGPEICDWLIRQACPLIGRARVYDARTGDGRIEAARSNSAVNYDIGRSDMILMLLRARIAASVHISGLRLENTSILHYAPGQTFEPHFDFLDPAQPAYARDIAANGQRVATFLLYLNEGYEGGETEFPELGWRHKGAKGDALLFWNVTPSGAPDSRALHAGLPPSRGEKWLFSQWLRQRTRPDALRPAVRRA